jgi:hypothetical protein
MFTSMRLWWARRQGLVALLLSLRRTPETWSVNSFSAQKNGVYIYVNARYDHPWRFYYVTLSTNGGPPFQLSHRWGRRFRKAIRKADEFASIKTAVKALASPVD